MCIHYPSSCMCNYLGINSPPYFFLTSKSQWHIESIERHPVDMSLPLIPFPKGKSVSKGANIAKVPKWVIAGQSEAPEWQRIRHVFCQIRVYILSQSYVIVYILCLRIRVVSQDMWAPHLYLRKWWIPQTMDTPLFPITETWVFPSDAFW